MAKSNQRESEAYEALKSAVYRHALRAEYAGRTKEHDHLVKGGGEASLAYITATIDVEQPNHVYWGAVLDAIDALIVERTSGLDATIKGSLW